EAESSGPWSASSTAPCALKLQAEFREGEALFCRGGPPVSALVSRQRIRETGIHPCKKSRRGSAFPRRNNDASSLIKGPLRCVMSGLPAQRDCAASQPNQSPFQSPLASIPD